MRKLSFSRKFRRSLLYTVLLAALLGTGIYAWIFGDSAPTVSGSMKIGDTSGLVFQINEQDMVLVDLNKELGVSTKQMALNEVSSADGVTFIKRDMAQYFPESGNPVENREILTFRPAEQNSIEIDPDEEGGYRFTGDYVHTDLILKLAYAEEGTTYYIYFLDGSLGPVHDLHTGFTGAADSFITEDGLKALRAAVTVEGAAAYGSVLAGETHRCIFGNQKETVSDQMTQAIVSTEEVLLRLPGSDMEYPVQTAGTFYIDYLDKKPGDFGVRTEGMEVQSFADFSIDGADGLIGAALPADADYLFALDSTCPRVSISLDLWLEGGSKYCQNSDVYVDDPVDFNMYLVAYKVTAE